MSKLSTLFIILLISHCLVSSGQSRAVFTMDKSAGCSPLIVHFSPPRNLSPNAVFQWQFGNGNVSALASPEAAYTTPGSYTVTLTIQDGGQQAVATATVNVYTPPVVNFTPSATKVCAPSPITFTSNSSAPSGAIASYVWDFGDGTTASVSAASVPGSGPSGNAGVAHSFFSAGGSAIPGGPGGPATGPATATTETVSLTVTDNYGCAATKVQPALVTILPPLTASFNTNRQVLCAVTDPVQFTNTSTGPGTLSYQWSFGDGNGSTQTSPAYSYSQKNTYSVILTATSSEGCVASDTQSNVLNVANYKTDFSLPPTACQGSSDVFNDLSSPAPTTENWQVDGAPAGNGSSLTWVFSSPGTHNITLNDVFGTCPQQATKTYTVSALPVPPPFDAVVQGKCGAPANVNFTDHTPGATAWSWIFQYSPYEPASFQTSVQGGPGNSYNYGSNQGFDVLLTVTNAAGCSASIVQTVTLTAPVEYIYETDNQPESSCDQPITKSYALQTPAQVKSFTWVFGDGTTSTDPTPTHTFTGYGEYITYLQWTDVNGCTGVSNSLYTIISKPLNLDFTASATTACVGQELFFGGPSLATNDGIFNTWTFGDGTQWFSSDGAVHTYTQPGVYTVSFYVQNAACSQTIIKNNLVTILAGPTVSISSTTNSCAGTRGNVEFTVAVGGGATSLNWDFGDGATLTTDASVTDVVHSYTLNGVYTVTVTASNGGCTSQSTEQVRVQLRGNPVLTGGPSTICPDGSLLLTLTDKANLLSSGVPGYGGIVSYETHWFYSDSTAFTGSDVNTAADFTGGVFNWTLSGFQTGKKGIFAISLTNFFGCYDTTAVFPLDITGLAVGYEIIQDDRCFTQPVVLQDTTKTSGGDVISSWLWNWGDGQTSTASGTVSHQYAAPGSYFVKLTVQDAGGCASSSPPVVAQVTVDGPLASFISISGNSAPTGSTLTFFNTTNTSGTTNTLYSWDFGDGSTSTDVSPSHLYPLPGTYTVTLTARDAAGGCVSTATVTIVIKPFNSAFQQNASYIAGSSCPPVLVQFFNTSFNYVSLVWDFGDGITVTDVANPSHVYKDPGTYIVSLTVTASNGSTKTTIDSVVVAQASAVLSSPKTQVCVNQPVALQARTNLGVTGYTWDYGDGVIGSGKDSNIVHDYATAGQYQAKLIVTDTVGCSAAATPDLSIDVQPPPVVGLSLPPTICLNSNITLQASGGTTYAWSPSAGLSRTDIANPVASPPSSTTYTVMVADAIGCSNTGTILVQVVQPEKISVSPDSVAVCPGQPVKLKASGTDVYSWIGETAGLSSTQAANPVAEPGVTTVYTVTGSDAQSCFSDTATVIVEILPQPTVNAGPDLLVQGDVPVTLATQGSSDITQWQWTPATGLSCTDCAQPVCTPKQPVKYIVTATNAAGCSAKDTLVVNLICDEAKVRIPEAFTPNGDGHNDRFNILGISEVIHLVIYDRWGQKVFERNHFFPADPGSGWDGTVNGQPAQTGTYAYFVEMQCPAGGVFTRRGTVVLVR